MPHWRASISRLWARTRAEDCFSLRALDFCEGRMQSVPRKKKRHPMSAASAMSARFGVDADHEFFF
jgi:hypothetical protein